MPYESSMLQMLSIGSSLGI